MLMKKPISKWIIIITIMFKMKILMSIMNLVISMLQILKILLIMQILKRHRIISISIIKFITVSVKHLKMLQTLQTLKMPTLIQMQTLNHIIISQLLKHKLKPQLKRLKQMLILMFSPNQNKKNKICIVFLI